jgi:large subunit ribosomal protein L22
MESVATHKNARISSRKVRLFRGLLRGLPVTVADSQLRFMPGKAPQLLRAVLKSAVANATNNLELEAGALVVSDVIVNDGFAFKRFRPASRGMAHAILKRTAHITIVVEDRSAGAARPKKTSVPKTVTDEKAARPTEPTDETGRVEDLKSPGKGRRKLDARTVDQLQDKEIAARGRYQSLQQGSDPKKGHRRKSTKGK